MTDMTECFYAPKGLNHTVHPKCPSVNNMSRAYISYSIIGRNWMQLGVARCRVPFWGHCELDLGIWPKF